MAQGTEAGPKLLTPTLLGSTTALAAPAATVSKHKKATPPKMGEAFGVHWGDDVAQWSTLPGGGVVQFNLNRLTLSDFRAMRDHYQVNASLSVLTFMMHQLEWVIECDTKKIRDHCQANMERVWTRLIRAMAQSFWAGYSPNVLQWENDLNGNSVQLTKIKDLMPEECMVHWKKVDGWAPPGSPPPRIKVYDGIDQFGAHYPIPTENSFWYPLLMENGNYYGKKLLRPAFTSWYFSILMHLFSNRYFERFGEPIPVGRAPYDDVIDVDGTSVPGREVMLTLIQSLRNRSAVVLPDNRTAVGTGEAKYDYDIEYLESQMRGADFERYLMRLDEEVTLSLFTPLLMLRTADVGSYNLGNQQTQVYQQMLNALAGDGKEYIDNYILGRMVDFNFGPNAKRATIKFKRLGNDKIELIKIMLQQLLANGSVMPDLNELGELAGMTLKEVEQVTEPPAKPDPEPASGPAPTNSNKLLDSMVSRVAGQIKNGSKIDLGYRRQIIEEVQKSGGSVREADLAYASAHALVVELAGMDFDNSTEALDLIKRGLENGIGELLNGRLT